MLGSTSLAFDSSGNGLTAANTFSMSVTSFLQNVANQNLSASLGFTSSLLPNFSTALAQTQVSDTTTAQAQFGPGSTTSAAPTTVMSASFQAAYNFNPAISDTVSLNASATGKFDFFNSAALVTTVGIVGLSDSTVLQAIPQTNLSVGLSIAEQPISADVVAMNCSFTVGRFNPNRKIMLVISDT